MKFLFTPKHQKLVNHCYPRGRTSEMKPNTSETSYLLYYVSSRRNKLEKVSKYLVKRTLHDIRHRKFGNIAVTTILMNEIIHSCNENLNIFIGDFLFILIKILTDTNINNDIIIVEHIEKILNSVCSLTKNNIFNWSSESIQKFVDFVESYFKVVHYRLHKDELLLKGCIDISMATNLACNQYTNHIVQKCVEYSLKKLKEKYPKFKIINLRPNSIYRGDSQKLSKSLQCSLNSLNIESQNDLEVIATRNFFNTTETDKLTVAVQQLLSHLFKIPNSELLLVICDMIPLQLRYIVVILLFKHLSSSNPNKKNPVIILKLISALLTSSISMIGLSVLDLMRKLLNFQLSNVSVKNVNYQCRNTIADLNNKIYYRSQTADMFYELLARIEVEKRSSYRHALKLDILTLIKSASHNDIPLPLCAELIRHLPNEFESIMEMSESENKSIEYCFYPICRILKFIENENDINKSSGYLNILLQKYKNIAIATGLKYLDSPDSIHDNEFYYTFHHKAADFLCLADYQEEVLAKKKKGGSIDETGLVSLLSGSNREIIQLTDIVQNLTSSGDYSMENSELNLQSSSNLKELNYRLRSSSYGFQTGNAIMNKNKNYYQKFSTLNTTSLKLTSSTTPTVKQLKHIYGSRYDNRDEKNSLLINNYPQSMRSKVTNITSLLNELKSCDEQSRTTNYDLDLEKGNRISKFKPLQGNKIVNLTANDTVSPISDSESSENSTTDQRAESHMTLSGSFFAQLSKKRLFFPFK
ncbi:hypothetical protein Kpol_1064p39 [Vanderwaltozyma polyspora DSM 70294]|uniref:Protein EFR3 n=1 Tax=Vanderwaltozyma polyspora (strain ATCC 22028 / DSM 70294 / BCRC 21397 / CBS 2163 / NBRC 10782 / NRRL Y-8283 / UCD 57-17) TaxID=436907 RepID=A7TMG3_VANPO|nr:uncharacterized protein Kpol_1064p39 [Vanderwaltozyma polyspora DSM 70294]EDO16557.1 hypothetical protein Kpol_1064p39 [Vanderwaltozyma polyspora DSM 70294]